MTSTAPLVERLRRTGPALSVGVLTADWNTLGAEVRILETAGVSVLHFDVMDGCFCPLLTMGPPLIKAVKTSLLKDVHLVIQDPLDKLEGYVAAGADIITVHVEACGAHPHKVLQALGTMVNANDPQRGLVRGIALNPGTPLTVLEPVMDEIDMVVLLAVNPGWSGQKFIHGTLARMTQVQAMIRDSGRTILLGIDGGITRNNIRDIAAARPDLLVTGSAVFDGKAAADNAHFLLNAIGSGR